MVLIIEFPPGFDDVTEKTTATAPDFLDIRQFRAEMVRACQGAILERWLCAGGSATPIAAQTLALAALVKNYALYIILT
jgi:hypothetical protein